MYQRIAGEKVWIYRRSRDWKDVYDGSADALSHMMFTSGSRANQMRVKKRGLKTIYRL